MQNHFLYKLTGTALVALGLTVAPVVSGPSMAQDADPELELSEPGTGLNQNLQQSEAALERLGAETIQGIEAAGAEAQQNVQEAVESLQTTQQTTQAAQQTATEAAEAAASAAERAEIAAQNAAANTQEGFDWGWLGLLGLIGLFGLAGGNRRRVEVQDGYRYQPTPTATPTTPTTPTNDYRSTNDYR
jgi:hypothetical protein